MHPDLLAGICLTGHESTTFGDGGKRNSLLSLAYPKNIRSFIMKKTYSLLTVAIVSAAALLACNLPFGGETPEPTVPALTVEATNMVDNTSLTPTTELVVESATPTPVANEPLLPAISDASEAVKAAYRFLLTTPHRVQATIISDNGTIEMTRQMQSASRVQISMDSDDFDSEIIIVDGEMWQKMNDMDWQKMPVASEMLADLTGVSEETLTWIKDVQFTGVELLDGTPCFVYTYGLEIDETDQASNMQNKLWINAVSGLPVQLESQGTAAGMTSQTVQRITPDPSIEVVAPVP
jgi:hypothetical protein